MRKENWIVKYWTDYAKNRTAQTREFPSQSEALRFIMMLSPNFRVHLDQEGQRA